MPDASTATQGTAPVNPAQEMSPVGTLGFGAREQTDARRQAGFQMAADEPEDINFNSVVARSQALTVDALGKSFASNEDFRQKMQDRYLAKVV